MSKEIRVQFKIKDGKIHLKNLQVTPEEYVRIAEIITKVVDVGVMKNHNFNASISVVL